MSGSEIVLDRLSKNTTMVATVRVARGFRLRLWLAARLMVLAALALGCGFELAEEVQVGRHAAVEG